MGNNLKPRQDSFCVYYTTIGSETYSNGTKAALAAEYSEISAHVTATKLLKQEAIRERIVELQATFEILVSMFPRKGTHFRSFLMCHNWAIRRLRNDKIGLCKGQFTSSTCNPNVSHFAVS